MKVCSGSNRAKQHLKDALEKQSVMVWGTWTGEAKATKPDNGIRERERNKPVLVPSGKRAETNLSYSFWAGSNGKGMAVGQTDRDTSSERKQFCKRAVSKGSSHEGNDVHSKVFPELIPNSAHRSNSCLQKLLLETLKWSEFCISFSDGSHTSSTSLPTTAPRKEGHGHLISRPSKVDRK